MQSVTMGDVAKLAAVSPSTVSLYLRRPSEVSPAISDRVKDAIDKLGYVPNLVAGGLASASARVVSIVVPSIRNAFFSLTVSRIEADLAGMGIQTQIGNSEYSLEVEEKLVRAALSWGPAAIVLTGLKHSEGTTRILRQRSIPVIEMWHSGEDPIMHSVGFSHHRVGYDIASHVLAKGFRKPIFVGARLRQDSRAERRSEGFVQALRERGVTPVVLQDPRPASTEVGRDSLRRVLVEQPGCDALVCSSDVIALGVLFEASRCGISIPSELAVTGFGNLEFSGNCNPAITTVEPNSELIARQVVDIIASHLRPGSGDTTPRTIETGFHIVERDSL